MSLHASAETGAGATPRTPARFAQAAFAVGAAAAVGALASGLGNRFGLWDFRTGFTVLAWSAWLGAAGAVLSLAALAWSAYGRAPRGIAWALIGLIAGALAFGLPWQMRRHAREVPPIHDISTDTESPPAFVALVASRRAAPNGLDYEGAAVAAQQKKAYPDIAPIVLGMSARAAFDRCLKTAGELGWNVVAAVPEEGRIEATDRTLFFGFTDDVVVRVKADGAGSRVDVRSESRVGRSDIGTNAKRIRAFASAVKAG